MTIKRIIDSFRSGEDLVYVARPVSFECGIAPRDARRTGARAVSRLTVRGSVSMARFGVSNPTDVEKRKERVLGCDFAIA